jgi:hypothetical protein
MLSKYLQPIDQVLNRNPKRHCKIWQTLNDILHCYIMGRTCNSTYPAPYSGVLLILIKQSLPLIQ